MAYTTDGLNIEEPLTPHQQAVYDGAVRMVRSWYVNAFYNLRRRSVRSCICASANPAELITQGREYSVDMGYCLDSIVDNVQAIEAGNER